MGNKVRNTISFFEIALRTGSDFYTRHFSVTTGKGNNCLSSRLPGKTTNTSPPH